MLTKGIGLVLLLIMSRSLGIPKSPAFFLNRKWGKGTGGGGLEEGEGGEDSVWMYCMRE